MDGSASGPRRTVTCISMTTRLCQPISPWPRLRRSAPQELKRAAFQGSSRTLQQQATVVQFAIADRLGLAIVDRLPDLIISDYHLANGKTGIEAIERLNAAFGTSIRPIVISGDTAPERLRDAKDKGYILLHKPVDLMRL